MSSYFDALNRRRAAPPAAQPPLREDPSRGEPPPADAPPRAHPLVIPRASGQPPTSAVLPEPYERLRERLLVAANGRALKTIVFAGCRGGEGCSQTVRELGQTLARSGLNVLVIDADRRTTESAPTIAVPAGDPASVGRMPGPQPAGTKGTGRLTIVPHQATGSDKEHFYRAPEFATWMEEQRALYDYVLLDAPPLLTFADATLMGRVSDGVVIVAEAEVTERESLTRASEQLQRAGVKIIGVVLNRARNPVPALLRPYLPIT